MTAVQDNLLALVGTRYREGGRNPSTGLDCMGLYLVAMRALGRIAREPAPEFLEALCAPEAIVEDHLPFWVQIKPARMARGDLVLMSSHGRHVDHCGIAVGSTHVLHASKTLGVIATRIDAIQRSGVLHSVWRWGTVA